MKQKRKKLKLMSNSISRSSRKLDHIKYALSLPSGPGTTGFEDVNLIHRCLPELAWEEVDLSTSFLGLSLSVPIIINAMTGGVEDVTGINRALARVAARTGLAMAVGSQTAALEKEDLATSFQVVRAENSTGIIFSNVGAHVSPEAACRAVEMLNADALQIHLNPAQELVMAEGERDFRGLLANIKNIVKSVSVPVIVKEVGNGISGRDAVKLADVGVKGLDISGRGGTNFIAIELARRSDAFGRDLLNWGIPTAVSLVETVYSLVDKNVEVVASGGIKTSIDIAKAIALGSQAVCIAAPFLKILEQEGEEALVERIINLQHELKMVMLLTGASTVSAMQNVPVIITGPTAQWLQTLGIPIEMLAVR
ncbi:MAG: type 2 isopentenyl-diphosphate Delta-isomerase [bacterium]|jgi:isopentenyl-diphosphate delta-isomerase